MPMFLVLMAASFILLILAFREPLRNEGNINVAKVGLSLCGAIMGIVGALSSFSIVENMGSAASTYETYTVSVSSYVIWNSPYITGALIISSVLCAIMFIYTLIQPAVLVTPEEDDYKSKAAGERT
jgi:chromate transport protein ChrA